MNLRKVVISLLLVGMTALTFASIGGGSSRPKNNIFKSSMAPLRSGRSLSLKSGLSYKGSLVIKEERTINTVSYRSLSIYQKGNATYIIPNRYRLSVSPDNNRSSLQMLNLRIKLSK